MITFKQLSIPDVFLLEPQVFNDERGFFYESFNQKEFEQAIGRKVTFVQDNHSKSSQGVLRGLHYQDDPYQQGKLVRVVDGEIWDVAVDIRPNSKYYGQWVAEKLSAENKKQLWIPEGFAHGFLTLSDFAEVLYKTNNFYDRACEKSIIWNDPTIKITWPSLDIDFLLSEKDKKAKFFVIN